MQKKYKFLLSNVLFIGSLIFTSFFFFSNARADGWQTCGNGYNKPADGSCQMVTANGQLQICQPQYYCVPRQYCDQFGCGVCCAQEECVITGCAAACPGCTYGDNTTCSQQLSDGTFCSTCEPNAWPPGNPNFRYECKDANNPDPACGDPGCSYSCGDSICCSTGGEDNASCPDDCSYNPTSCQDNPISASIYGSYYVSVYQGDPASLRYVVDSNSGNQGYSVTTTGCPTGAVCSGNQSGLSVDESDNPHSPSQATVQTGASTPLGDHTFNIGITSQSQSVCAYTLSYTIHVLPSRKSVCDGAWHPVPPNPYPYTVYSGPFILYDGTNSKATVNADYIAMTAPFTWQRADFSTLCRYYGGVGDTCTWDTPAPMPNTGPPFGAYTYGWQAHPGPFGSTASAVDGGGRTYTVQRSGNFISYKCTLPAPAITVSPSTFTFTAVSGAVAPAAQNLAISNSGQAGSSLNWRGQTNQNWCRVNGVNNSSSITGGPLAQSAASNVSVTMDAPSNAGSFGCTITASDNGSNPAITGGPKTANIT